MANETIVCVRPGCGSEAIKAMGAGGHFYQLCDCCWELLISWLGGDGEFHSSDWERRMITENMQALDQIDDLKRSSFRNRLHRLVFGG